MSDTPMFYPDIPCPDLAALDAGEEAIDALRGAIPDYAERKALIKLVRFAHQKMHKHMVYPGATLWQGDLYCPLSAWNFFSESIMQSYSHLPLDKIGEAIDKVEVNNLATMFGTEVE
jgi:hypothetical protein